MITYSLNKQMRLFHSDKRQNMNDRTQTERNQTHQKFPALISHDTSAVIHCENFKINGLCMPSW